VAVWSVVNLAVASDKNRLDAEFYQPDFLNNEEILRRKSSSRVGDCLVDMRYGLNVPPDYTETGLPFIRALNLKEGGIAGEVLNIPFTPDAVGKKSLLKAGDILVVRSGANVGDVGVITPDMEGWTFGSYVIRCRLKGLDPYFAYVFLLSSAGRKQTIRFRSGAAQPNISMPNLKEVLLLKASDDFQKNIRAVFEASILKRNTAKTQYAEAEAMLNDTLGLADLDLSPRLFYEARFADTTADARLDAEYFAPRTQNLIAALSRDARTIADVAPLAKRQFKPKPSQAFDYIEIGDVTESGTVESKSIPAEEAPSRAQWIVKSGDIVTSTVRPIRRLSALIQAEQSGFVCSSGFAVLQPKDIEPEILLTYLRLPLVCELLDLHTTASMYPAISTTDLLRIPISLPDGKSGQAIAEKVRESFVARKCAQAMLNIAKSAVEIAIDASEAAALRFLKEERG
jgi:type I restriction enzyme M protein